MIPKDPRFKKRLMGVLECYYGHQFCVKLEQSTTVQVQAEGRGREGGTTRKEEEEEERADANRAEEGDGRKENGESKFEEEGDVSAAPGGEKMFLHLSNTA